MKVIWDQLIEAAKTFTDFQSKYNISSAFNEKTNFFGWSYFFFFSRLQIYEAIVAIFWQSASYVFNLVFLWSEFFVDSKKIFSKFIFKFSENLCSKFMDLWASETI